jgi:formate dehydrogenase iron-sulfur subunit
VIGIGHSWLSREVVAFGAFAMLAALDALTPSRALDVAAAAAGASAIACSVMVYATTNRRWWRARASALRFGATAALLGLASLAAPSVSISLAVLAVGAGKLAWELTWHWPPARRRGPGDDLGRTALLLRRDLRTTTNARDALGVAGLICTALTLTTPSPWVAGVALVLLAAGELVERSLFFTAVSSPRMPGRVT